MKNLIYSGESINWQSIINEANNYRYVIFSREHFRGNAAGEYCRASQLASVMREYSHIFCDAERPIIAVTITNDNVGWVIKQRRYLEGRLAEIRYEHASLTLPRFSGDKRSSRRTNPAAWADYDAAVARFSKQSNDYIDAQEGIIKALEALPNYPVNMRLLTPKVSRHRAAIAANELIASVGGLSRFSQPNQDQTARIIDAVRRQYGDGAAASLTANSVITRSALAAAIIHYLN